MDIKTIENFFTHLSAKQLKMKVPVEISALAVMAGWRLNSRNMMTLAINVMGCIPKKIVSCADNKWGLP